MTTTTTLMPVYRRFLTDPGEPPILPDDLGVMLRRRFAFQAVTGLDDDHTHTDPLAAFPLPVYERRRWAGAVEFLWNPLAWLPSPLAAPPVIPGHSRSGAIPSTAMRVWAATCVLALGSSGLYSPELGWLDVAATYGIDLADPAVLLRAQAWLAGGSDPQFDAVEAHLHAVLLARTSPASTGALMSMLGVQRRCIADQIGRSLSQSRNPAAALTACLALGLDLLGDIPAFGHHLVGDIVLGMLAEMDGRDEELQAEAMADFTELLDNIADGVPIGGLG